MRLWGGSRAPAKPGFPQAAAESKRGGLCRAAAAAAGVRQRSQAALAAANCEPARKAQVMPDMFCDSEFAPAPRVDAEGLSRAAGADACRSPSKAALVSSAVALVRRAAGKPAAPARALLRGIALWGGLPPTAGRQGAKGSRLAVRERLPPRLRCLYAPWQPLARRQTSCG